MVLLIDFGGTTESPNFDRDRTIAFEMHGLKRNVRFLEFPIRCAASCTVHSAKGARFSTVPIARMRSQFSRSESLYAAVFRARSIDTLLFVVRILDETLCISAVGLCWNSIMK